MIVNHTINKIINSTEENTESLLDLTADSVSPENLLLNKTAHNSEGEGIVGEMPEGGAKDYDELNNRPQINSNLLTGNKTGSQLGLQNRVLASTLNIGGQTIGNVEGALSALNESKSDLVNGKVPVNELPVYQPVIGSIQSIGGMLPPSNPGDEDKYFRADGTWAKPSGGGGGVTDYDDLTNRPKVNGTTLSENKTGAQLGLQNIVLSSALSIGGQTITEVEPALRALNEKGGGHTIVDEEGTTYPARANLKFVNCTVTDDSTNDTTIIEAEGGGGVKKYAKPTITVGTYTYNGTTQAPTITGFDANVMTLTGTYEAINAGSYTFTIALSDKTSSKWTDDTQDDIVTNWSIDVISVAVPTVTGTTKTYNGSAQSPTITRDTANTSISGTTSATKVKSNYSFSIALTDTANHKWSDNTTAAKSYTWKINPPTGSSYTPVNNIQAWLQCASIDKTYTTIAQVLADATTLSALMLSNNAVDYLVRSTSWTSNITGNQTAMTYIGASDYCANKLLANSTWRTAICNSTYMESVLNVKVPTMTSNTTPSGECFAIGNYTGYPPYYAFDKSNSTKWLTTNSGATMTDLYIGYYFGRKISIIVISALFDTDTQSVSYKIQGSDDGVTYTDVALDLSDKSGTAMVIQNDTAYNYYRLYINSMTTPSASHNGGRIIELQFYGR